MDFLMMCAQQKKDMLEISPDFEVKKSKDLMIRGGDFYAIWDDQKGLWSTDEDDALKMIDYELYKYAEEHKIEFGNRIKILLTRRASTHMIDRWHKYCKQDQRDNFTILDEKLIFSNQEVHREDYASKKLPYPLIEGDISAWDKLIGTLYSPEERHKIEWAIGSIVSGDSKELQKFMVLYGAAGTGKSTVLGIIEQLFKGYVCTFDARSLGDAKKDFAFEAFRDHPLVAIQHDGDLSHIEDNTRLNSLVSHETVLMNVKHKSAYPAKIHAFLFMGTNKPVRITDAKSGLMRRLIDVRPSGNKLAGSEYRKIMGQIKFEYGAIAYHCLKVYESDPRYYDDYAPLSMISASNDFYNYIQESYPMFEEENGTTLDSAWKAYKAYCEDAKVSYPMSRRAFQEELKNYFKEFKERFETSDGKRVRSYYLGFKTEIFENKRRKQPDDQNENDAFKLNFSESIFDQELRDCPAQYSSDSGVPKYSWKYCRSSLKDLDTSKEHYVKVPLNHIVIDFDIKDENGNKSFELNAKEASKWPKTYAELSRGGQGIHLHYIYDGDPTKLDRTYDKDIEIKVFTGNSALRRKLSKCNDLPINHISSGLPIKKGDKKVISQEGIKSEKKLRELLMRCMLKEIHPGTKPSVDFIKKLLDDAYENGMKYDVNDLYNDIYAFAANSTNHSEYCRNVVKNLHYSSEENSENEVSEDDTPIIFFDVEVFVNLFVICWKALGSNCPPCRLINPAPAAVEELMNQKLVGFNNRKYDNHIIYARSMGYTNEMLYNLSQQIILEHKGYFRQAYNLGYTDIYDFASAGNKMSLKKLEIKMGITHSELAIPWDQPVSEDRWEEVADYCCNDVLATEAAFEYLQSDFVAREILADMAGGTVNDTTNQLSTKFIFGNNKNPQDEFYYRDLSKPVKEIDPEFIDFLKKNKPNILKQRHGKDESILPYFPGYEFDKWKRLSKYKSFNGEGDNKPVGEGGFVISIPGIWRCVALLDVESMHPNSAIAEVAFGIRYTTRFKEILDARVAVKHKDWDKAKTMLNGVLKKHIQKVIDGEITAKDLANALKTVINSVYGLTSASFENAFKDPRNIDNIIAKRGALFMIDLKEAVEEQGYIVAHIKTDSIKIPNANKEIIEFVKDFGEKYGYTFNHEATYDRMALVNEAVYIAKYMSAEECLNQYGYVPDDNNDHGGEWTATGAQFQKSYIFKTLFNKEEIDFKDVCETINVTKGALYLDLNEGLPNVEEYEKELDKANDQYKKGKIGDTTYNKICDDLIPKIETGHSYHFVGRVGQFCPMKEGCKSGVLYRMQDDKYYAPSGTKGYRWMESEMVKNLGLEDYIDYSYYENLCDEAKESIEEYGSFNEFVLGPDIKIPF